MACINAPGKLLLPAFAPPASTHTGRLGLKPRNCWHNGISKCFCEGRGWPDNRPGTDAPRQPLPIQHLRPIGRQRVQQTSFAQPGRPAQHLTAQSRATWRGHTSQHGGLNALHAPSSQCTRKPYWRQRPAALATAPTAVQQGASRLGLGLVRPVCGNVAGHGRRQASAQLARLKRADTCVQGVQGVPGALKVWMLYLPGFKRGASTGHTLLRMMGWASAVG